MRDPETIEREIREARDDLEQNLGELRHAVQEKIDVKARARVLAQKGKQQARELYARGKQQAHHVADVGKARARDLYGRGRQTAQDRPEIVIGAAAGVIVLATLIYIGRKRDWF